jgi:hypothetical protein
MALLFRIVTNPKWVAPGWMATGEVPADALTDLRSENNELSVWSVEQDRSNVDTALAAAAGARKKLDKIDYTLIDEGILPGIRIKCVKSEGQTPHTTANTSMHHDLTELTVRKISDLAHAMMPLERMRLSEKKVKRLLQDALQGGALDRARIDPKLLTELQSTDG